MTRKKTNFCLYGTQQILGNINTFISDRMKRRSKLIDYNVSEYNIVAATTLRDFFCLSLSENVLITENLQSKIHVGVL